MGPQPLSSKFHRVSMAFGFSLSVATKSQVGPLIIQAALLDLDIPPCTWCGLPLMHSQALCDKKQTDKKPKTILQTKSTNDKASCGH